MRSTLSGRPARSLVPCLFGIGLAACASNGTTSNPDAGEPDGASSSSSSGSSSGPVSSSSSGSSGSSSSGSSSGGASSSSGSSSGGADAGSESGVDAGTLRYSCPSGTTFTAPTQAALAALAPTKIAGLPPSDSFNNDNNNFGIIEGPVWNGEALYVSEIGTAVNGMPPPARMLMVTTDGTVSIAIADSGSNGLAVDIHNTIFGAIHEDGSISSFDLATMVRTPVATGYMGARFDSPNDLAIRSDGNIYFSDPDDQAPAVHPQTATRLYRVAAGTDAVSVIDATLTEPNGVTLSLDESTLFVTTNNGIWKYPVMSDGSVGAGSLLNPSLNTFSGDGMAIDCAGDLYIAAQNSTNVMVVSPAGSLIGMISLPTSAFQAVTNLAFGGADHKTLYITGLGNNKGLYQVPMSLPGMPY
jgi:gluconolactonase